MSWEDGSERYLTEYRGESVYDAPSDLHTFSREGDTMNATRENHLRPAAALVYADVIVAMQNAEEMGGPEGHDYDALMSAIIAECDERIRAHHSWWSPTSEESI